MPRLIPQQFGKILYHATEGLSGKKQEQAIQAFLQLVRSHQLTKKIDYIIAAYETYARKQSGGAHVSIRTAKPLSAQEIEKIAKAFDAKEDPEVIVDEDLIGGVAVRVGDTIHDSSIKEQLRRLQTSVT